MKHWARIILEDVILEFTEVPSVVLDGLVTAVELIENDVEYHFRLPILKDLADDISECDQLEGLAKLLWRVSVELGFQNFSIFLIKHGKAGIYGNRQCSSLSELWLERYSAKNYQWIDPVLQWANQVNNGAISFSELDSNSPLIEEYWLDAENHKVGRNGACFVHSLKRGSKIAVLFHSRAPNSIFSRSMDLNASDLRFLSRLAAECFWYASFGTSPIKNPLDNHELRFLFKLVTGETELEALNVTGTFGSNISLQVSIRRKLGLDNAFQAVAYAALNGWFDDLHYHPEEVIRPFQPLKGLRSGNFLL